MSLLFITQNYHPNKGGMAESCDRIVRSFRKNKVEVHVMHFTNRRPKFEVQTEVNGSYTALPIFPSEEFTLNLATNFIEQLPFLKSIKYIFAFGAYLPLNLAPILSKYFQIPLISLIRGNDFDEAIFSKRREVLLYALENSKTIFSVSQEKRDKIKQLISHEEVYFSPNGIDSSLWIAQKSHLPQIETLKNESQGKIRLLIIGQLKAKKGILEFCANFTHFTFKDEYEIWLVGDIEEETKTAIENMEIQSKFYPFASKNDLLKFYYCADIIAIPSFYDGMPNVLLEAGATQNLVLASKVGGIKDVIEDKKDGFLFDPLNASSLLEALHSLHRLPQEKKQEIATNLYQKIKRFYTQETEIDNYLKHLEL